MIDAMHFNQNLLGSLGIVIVIILKFLVQHAQIHHSYKEFRKVHYIEVSL